MQTITPARSYRAYLIPHNLELDDVEAHAARGLLPTIRLKAANAEDATQKAWETTAKRVLTVERVEEAAA